MATLLPAWMTQKCPTTLSALQMDELFHHLYIPLQRFMGRRLRDEQQLADAIEDLLHRVARRPYVPGLDKSPRDWLFLESDYTVLDSMRAFARRQKREGLDQPEKVDAGATVPSPSEKMARSDLIQKALATLSPKLQRIFTLARRRGDDGQGGRRGRGDPARHGRLAALGRPPAPRRRSPPDGGDRRARSGEERMSDERDPPPLEHDPVFSAASRARWAGWKKHPPRPAASLERLQAIGAEIEAEEALFAEEMREAQAHPAAGVPALHEDPVFTAASRTRWAAWQKHGLRSKHSLEEVLDRQDVQEHGLDAPVHRRSSVLV